MRTSHLLFWLTAIFIALLLAGCQTGPQVILPSPMPTAALVPTATSTPEATPTPTPVPIPADAVQVNLYCTVACEERVSSDDFVVIYWFWVAKSRDLVQAFLENVEFEVAVNGEAVANPEEFMGPVAEYEEGDYDGGGQADYWARWQYPLGELAPGTHTITLTLDFSVTMTDGFDINGDGRLDEYGPGAQVFTVRVVAS